jgi:drug/metabolite transporter (DMT)-like permease
MYYVIGLSLNFSQDSGITRALLFNHYRSVKGHLLAVAATAISSGNFVVARILAHSVPPVTLVVLRSAIAIIVLLPFVLRPLGNQIPIIRKHLGYIALTAFLGLTVCQTVVYAAAVTSPALNLTLIAICSPIFTLVFARLFLRDTLTTLRVIGLITATSGVFFLITDGQPSRLAHLTFSEGDIWMLGQAASFALYSTWFG